MFDYRGQFKNWTEAVSPIYNYSTHTGIPLYIIRGNHEDGGGNIPVPELLSDYRTIMAADMPKNGPPGQENLTYSVTHKNVKFIALDEYYPNNGVKETVNQSWLDEQLTNDPGKFLFVTGHSPAYNVTSDNEEFTLGIMSHPAQRDIFWNSLVKNHVIAYFCGHVHSYIRTESQGVQQVLVGNGGAPADPFVPSEVDPILSIDYPTHPVNASDQKFGYLVVTVHEGSGTFDAVEKLYNSTTFTWETGDVFTIRAFVPPTPAPEPGPDDDGPPISVSTAGTTPRTDIVNVGGGSAVTRAVMTGTGLGRNLVITAFPKDTLPGTMTAPPTTVFQYMSITTSTITGIISETTLDFSVPESWITGHGFTPNDIVMMHNVGGQWQTLDTRFVQQNVGIVQYRATTPGFSYFAIAYQKGGTIAVTGTPVPATLPVVTAPVTSAPLPVLSTLPVTITPAKRQTLPPGPSDVPVEKIPLTIIMAGIIGTIVIITGAFLVRRWWIRRQNPALFRKYD